MFFRRKKGAPDAAGKREETPARAPGSEPGAGVAAGTSTQFLTGDQARDRATVQILLDAIARVSTSRDIESLLVDIVDRSIEVTGAERGLLVLAGDGEELAVRVSRQRGGKPLEGELRFSTTVARRVLDKLEPVRATVHSDSEALELGRSVYDLKLRAVMCVPLSPGQPDASRDGEDRRDDGQATGVLYVDSRAATRQFSQRDLGLFAALAQHISIALENTRLHLDSLEKVRLEQSLELASAIQRDLMPRIPENIPGYEIDGWYRPAEETAGDFYDFVQTGDRELAVVVGDVTGHGIGPALITAAAQASLRSYLRLISEPGRVLTMLNQDLCERSEDGHFLTLFMAVLGKDGRMRPLNAGHAPPLVWRAATGSIEDLGRGGPALGMIPDEVYPEPATLRLEPNDVLVAFTDGLIEARHPDRPDELFGEEGVRRVLREAADAGRSAKEITTRIVEEALSSSGDCREDDMTLVVVRRTS